jgi:YcxB-like protein
MHRLTLTYSKPLLRQAVWGFWWRLVGWRFIAAMALVAGSLAMLVLRGDTSWVVGALASVLVFGIAVIVALYVVHYRNALHKLKAMGHPQATFEASEAQLWVSSGAGTATLPWTAVTEIWQLKSCWLLLFSKAQFITLPRADMTPETAAFIAARVQAAGGKVS